MNKQGVEYLNVITYTGVRFFSNLVKASNMTFTTRY